MLEKIIDFIGKITLLIFFIAVSIVSVYGVIYLGGLLIKWLKVVV